MLRWLLALVVTGVLSTFAVLLLIADYDDDDGRVLLHLTETHGVHTGDLFIVVGWAVAVAALLGLLVVAGRRSSRLHRAPACRPALRNRAEQSHHISRAGLRSSRGARGSDRTG